MDKIKNGGDKIKQFYEKYPFPNDKIKKREDLDKNKWILNVLSEKPKGKILDVGCGTGEISCYLSQFGDVTGIDFCISSINLANKLKDSLKINNVNFYTKDIIKEKLEEKYDYIFSIGVLHHIPEIEKAIDNIKKGMVKDTILVVGLNNKWFDRRNRLTGWNFKKEHISREKDFSSHPYHKTLTKKEAIKLLQNSGFEVLNIWRDVSEIVRFLTAKGGVMLFKCKLK